MIWFNFIKTSKRFVEINTAKEIIKHIPKNVFTIWVFNADDIENIAKTTKELGLNWIQLHNVQSTDFIIELKNELYRHCEEWGTNDEAIQYPLIIISISYSKLNEINQFKDYADLFIIDSEKPWSWEKYDYSKLKWIINVPFLIAWWINENNAKEAMNCDEYCIWIDVASGIEENGEVSEERIKRIKGMIG